MAFCLHDSKSMCRIFTICLFALSMLLGPFQKGYADEKVPSAEEISLLQLINEARRDPLSKAASLGMDPESVLRDLPELYDVLTKGLSPLDFSEKLYEAALGHTEDMVASVYYSHTSLDGRTYADRIRESGYVAAGCGESLGVVAFQNVITPEEAVIIIFKSIFLNELNPETTEVRNILNPERTEAGIALGSGQFIRDGLVLNAFVATLDFGKPIVETKSVQRALFGMLNAARRSPEGALLNAGIDPATALEAYGNARWVLSNPLPPLVWDDKLQGTAAAHNYDMRDNRYLSILTPDGLTPFDRVAAAGYDPAHVGESVGVIWEAADTPSGVSVPDVARRLYESILAADVDPESGADRNIFAPFVTELGISVAAVFQDSDGQLIGYVVVVDFAQPREERSFVVGTVCEDRNGNNQIDDNEGVSGVEIIVKSTCPSVEGMRTATSDATGYYQINASSFFPDLMQVYAKRDADIWGPFYVMAKRGTNVLKDIEIPPRSEDNSTSSGALDKKKLDTSLQICY